MAMQRLVIETNFLAGQQPKRGKVRDIYPAGDGKLLIVATDRISAFDGVLSTSIPNKGRVLTMMSDWWFNLLESRLGIQHHVISTDVRAYPKEFRDYDKVLDGRSMLVQETEVFPVECVVRGNITGSGWKDYKRTGEVCGHKLREGLLESEELDQPIFTPATKAATGHDENITFEQMVDIVGREVAEQLRLASILIFRFARHYAKQCGIIIADTKFEFGKAKDGGIMLVDEVLTPDSSRFWSATQFEPGQPQTSFDKQLVRDYIASTDWDQKTLPAPELPSYVVMATTQRYLEAYRLLTGRELS